MKTLKTTIAIILISLVSNVFATPNVITKKSIEKEIKTTLKKIDIAKYDIEEESTVITFFLNSKNEIEVQNVDAKSKELENAIREQLNGMVSNADLSTKVYYSIKISFVVIK